MIVLKPNPNCRACHGRGQYEENQSPIGSGCYWPETMTCDCIFESWPEGAGMNAVWTVDTSEYDAAFDASMGEWAKELASGNPVTNHLGEHNDGR